MDGAASPNAVAQRRDRPLLQRPAGEGDAKVGPRPDANQNRRRHLLLAGSLLTAWCLVLAALAYFSANQPTLNPVQILHADYLVTATIADQPQGVIDVAREWKQQAGFERIVVPELADRPPMAAGPWLIPLSRQPDGRLRITQGPLENTGGDDHSVTSEVPPLVYPATPEMIDRLTQVLNHSGRVLER